MFHSFSQRKIGGFGHCAWPVAVGCALAVGSLAAGSAQAAQDVKLPQDLRAESTDEFYTFPGRPIITVSRHGNIVRFQAGSGAGGAGHFYAEGYVLCYGGVQAYDRARTEFGFSSQVNASCFDRTCNFSRNTSDGTLQLRQTITHLPDEARGVDVTMTVVNLRGFPVSGVTLRRLADIDVDAYGTGIGGNINWWGASEVDSVWAWNAANNHAGPDSMILMRHLARTPATFPYGPKVTEDYSDVSCNPTSIAGDGPVRGDYAATMQYNIGSIRAFGSASVKLQYTRN